ncbi:hypothetical protein CRE_05888 [Caenorhabditis remanei]|uniref:Uncharacterized protein n=1 Tax=Caenorhabditis remanei TaxID=31234 RepID=E3MNL4_CAERE|nr:hypothetical protein CRE_05888 [Caenorhabditis remanei]
MEESMEMYEAKELAEKLAEFTLKSVKDERVYQRIKAGGVSLSEFPSEVLVQIFRHVASPTFNPPPPLFLDYIKFKNEDQLKKRKEMTENYVKERVEKEQKEYSVKNLMALRRVCVQFDEVIDCKMMPGLDYDPIMIDVKIQGSEHGRQVTAFKYGGSGSNAPAVRINRMRGYNEWEYQHIKKFEKLQKLYIVDMLLSEEVLQTVLRLDLTSAKKITFERIKGLKFDETTNVAARIQEFLGSLDSPAMVYFNSNVFDPNIDLFEQKEDDEWGSDDEEMEVDVVERGLVRRDTYQIEHRPKNHRRIRNRQRTGGNTKEFRGFRTINVMNHILLGQRHSPDDNLTYGHPSGQQKYKSDLKMAYETLTMSTRFDLRKAGRWHLRNAFNLLGSRPVKSRKALLFHLKSLKKITGDEPLTTEEELAIIHHAKETEHREKLLQESVPVKKWMDHLF